MINNLPVKTLDAQRPHDRGLLAGRRADLLADPGVEDRLRPRRAAVVVHGHAHVVRLAHAHGPLGGPAGLRGAAADDEDGAARRSTCPRRPSNRCERVLRLFSRMDRGRLPCTLLPARPGDEIELSREQVVTVSATTHTVPSLGFVVWERRRKLKPEYPGPARRENPRSAPRRHGRDRRGPPAAGGLSGRQFARRARRLPGHVRGRSADHGD